MLNSNVTNELQSTNNKILPLVFAFFLIINVISTGGHSDWSDGTITYLIAESMVLKHSAKLHPDIPSITTINGPFENEARSQAPYYTHRPIMLAAVAVPFYYTAVIASLDPLPLVGMFVNSLIVTLIALVVFRFSDELFQSRKVAFILSLILLGCSFILPYNTTLFPQPLQALCLISAAYFLFKSKTLDDSSMSTLNTKYGRRKTYFACLASLFLGLSIFSHPTSLIFIPGFIIYSIFFSQLRIKHVVLPFIVSLIVLLFLVGLINFLKFGSFTEFGYGWMGSLSTHAGFEGLIGLWASPGAGLVLFFPIVLVLPIALKIFFRWNRGIFFLTLYMLMTAWAYFGTLWYLGSYWQTITWSGGLAWGPRYLIPILPFLVIPFGILLRKLPNHNKNSLLSICVLSLCIAGFLVNLPGNLVWIYHNWDYAIMREGLLNDDNIYDVITWDLGYSPISLSVKILIENYVSDIRPEEYLNNSAFFYITYGLAPCSIDSYLYCKFGAIPILALGIIDCILALLILKDNARPAIRKQINISPKHGERF
jgi:hypothetical protein